jgi:hypothetical protein
VWPKARNKTDDENPPTTPTNSSIEMKRETNDPVRNFESQLPMPIANR